MAEPEAQPITIIYWQYINKGEYPFCYLLFWFWENTNESWSSVQNLIYICVTLTKIWKLYRISENLLKYLKYLRKIFLFRTWIKICLYSATSKRANTKFNFRYIYCYGSDNETNSDNKLILFCVWTNISINLLHNKIYFSLISSYVDLSRFYTLLYFNNHHQLFINK